MIKILCLHIAKNQASYHYRVEQLLGYWNEYDIELHPVTIVGKKYGSKIKLALQSRHYDFVWLQRKTLSPFIVNIITNRTRLIYDFDDALYTRQTGHDGTLKDKHPGSQQTIKRINHILKKSSLIFAGSKALARYAEIYNPGNVHLLPTALEKPGTPVPGNTIQNRITIGWIGSIGNLPYLELIDEAAAEMQKKFPGASFSVMSGKPPENLKTRWNFVPWSAETEHAWLQSIDIGIMPLTDDEWSRGKCAFKLLQYMSHQKPVIASAVGANMSTVQHGENGFLATTTAEWCRALEALISNRALRHRMGQESLHIFETRFERSIIQEKIASIVRSCICCSPGCNGKS